MYRFVSAVGTLLSLFDLVAQPFCIHVAIKTAAHDVNEVASTLSLHTPRLARPCLGFMLA